MYQTLSWIQEILKDGLHLCWFAIGDKVAKSGNTFWPFSDNSEPNIDLNGRDVKGWTAFMLDVVQLILDHSEPNIDLDAIEEDGWTPLIQEVRLS